MALYSESIYGTNGKDVIDISSTFRRSGRFPLDAGSLFSSYATAVSELAQSLANLYEGQLVSILPGTSHPNSDGLPVPYIVGFTQNLTSGTKTYMYERIITQSYVGYILQNYGVVQDWRLGVDLTGVGKWYDVSYNETTRVFSHSYGEIFNNYVRNVAKDWYSHAEGDITYANGRGAHAEGQNTYSTGIASHAEGLSVSASGDGAHAEGLQTAATGDHSHAEGSNSIAEGDGAHAEGQVTLASGAFSHAGGDGTIATGNYSRAIGHGTYSIGNWSHAEGHASYSHGIYSHSEGENAKASGTYSHAEGQSTLAQGNGAHTEGYSTTSAGEFAHSEGISTSASMKGSHSEGLGSSANGNYSHAEGNMSMTVGQSSHAEGSSTTTRSQYSHAEGDRTGTDGIASHSEGFFTIAKGDYSHAEGNATYSGGENSHSEGINTYSHGAGSHTEGKNTTVSTGAPQAHAEGLSTSAEGASAHAEGESSRATAQGAHAEGSTTVAGAKYSHAEGLNTQTGGQYSHSEGSNTQTKADAAHAEGIGTKAEGKYSHSEGYYTTVTGIGGHAEGKQSIAAGTYSHAEGELTKSQGQFSHTGGRGTYAGGIGSDSIGYFTGTYGDYSHSEGYGSSVTGTYGHSEGKFTYVIADGAHAEGYSTYAKGIYSHIEGYESQAIGTYSHGEGLSTTANGKSSHAEGISTNAAGEGSHAEGYSTTASTYAHAEGGNTTASGLRSHAEGNSTTASGAASHAGGTSSVAQGGSSTSIGQGTQTYNTAEFSTGRWSKSYTGNTYLEYCYIDQPNSGGTIFTIGNGTATNSRRNIYAIHENGDSIKTEGVSYYTNELYAPVSYSYVESLGITAYLTTVLSALLENPKYARPTVGIKFVGHNGSNFYTTSQTTDIQFGNTINLSVAFRAAYVCPNYNDVDPKYGTNLGNRLGYSTGVTSIRFKYNDGNGATNTVYYTYNCGSYTRSLTGKNNKGDNVTVTAQGLTYGNTGTILQKSRIDDTGIYSGRIFTYNASNGVQSFNAYAGANLVGTSNVYGDSVNLTFNSAFKMGSEKAYTLVQFISYEFTPSTQMYFQQLADKMTYVPNDGLAPTDKMFADPGKTTVSYTSGNIITWTVRPRMRYFYGTTNSTITSAFNVTSGTAAWFDVRSFNDGKNHGDISETKDITLNVTGGPKTIWVAVPSDHIYNNYSTCTQALYTHMATEDSTADAAIRTASNNSSYTCAARVIRFRSDSFYQITTSAGTGVIDTGFTNQDAMALRKIRTANTVANTGLYYDIYYCNGAGNIATGTAKMRVKRVW